LFSVPLERRLTVRRVVLSRWQHSLITRDSLNLDTCYPQLNPVEEDSSDSSMKSTLRMVPMSLTGHLNLTKSLIPFKLTLLEVQRLPLITWDWKDLRRMMCMLWECPCSLLLMSMMPLTRMFKRWLFRHWKELVDQQYLRVCWLYWHSGLEWNTGECDISSLWLFSFEVNSYNLTIYLIKI
jgi:hypothetical protein